MTSTPKTIEELRAASDHPDWQELCDWQERVDANEPPVPPCPSWCRYPYSDHSYDSVNEDELTYSRFHCTADDSIAQEEFNRGGVVTLGPMLIGRTDEQTPMTAGQARQEAAALLNAADRLDEITGGSA